MTRITMKLSSTSLPLSRLALSWLNQPLLLHARLSPWYVDMMQLHIFFMSKCTFLQLFGWELESLWQTANEKLCFALLKAGRLGEAFESYKYGMDASDEATRSGLRAWIFSKSFSNATYATVLNYPSLSHLVIMNVLPS